MWWPVRNVDAPWAGDGIGIILFGALGLLIGTVAGIIAAFLFLRGTSRIKRMQIEQAAHPGDGN